MDRMNKNCMNKAFLLVFLTLFSFFAFFSQAGAASFILSSPASLIEEGKPFALSVLVDAQGDKINALSGKLVFSSRAFAVERIDMSKSILSHWTEEPKKGRRGIEFSGIIAGGFSGLYDPFAPEHAMPAEVFTAYLVPKTSGYATAYLADGSVFLDDGSGLEKETAIAAYSFEAVSSGEEEKSLSSGRAWVLLIGLALLASILCAYAFYFR